MLDLKPVTITNSRELNNAFRELDKDAKKEIRQGVKSSIGKVTSQMQTDIRTMVDGAPLSGMYARANPAQNWTYPLVKPSFTPSGAKGRIAQITAKGSKGAARMFAITELAGSRSDGFTPSGQRMVRVLRDRFPLVKGRGGRFVFHTFVKHRTLMHDQVEFALNLFATKTNMRLKRG